MRYRCVFSLFVISLKWSGDLQIVGAVSPPHWRSLLKCTLTTLVFGWWDIPMGPFWTLAALSSNLTGGSRESVREAVARLKWGHTRPGEAGANLRDVVELSARAATEIRARRVAGQFAETIAVRIRLIDSFQRRCAVEFDFAASDGRDWIGKAGGQQILIDKVEGDLLMGTTIDFESGEFIAI